MKEITGFGVDFEATGDHQRQQQGAEGEPGRRCPGIFDQLPEQPQAAGREAQAHQRPSAHKTMQKITQQVGIASQGHQDLLAAECRIGQHQR